MSYRHAAFVAKSFLRSHWDLEYRARHDSENEKALDDHLALWSKRTDWKETSAESAFIDLFFRETWDYVQTGQRGSDTGFSLYPKFAIPVSGANGGSGEADLAVGYFNKTAPGQSPQAAEANSRRPRSFTSDSASTPARHPTPPSPMASFRFRSTG